MIGMNALGQNGRLGNQMFQYAALVGIAKNLGYDHCIPDHSKVTWFDRMEGDQIITQHHQLQHLFEMNHLNGRFGEATEYNINLSLRQSSVRNCMKSVLMVLPYMDTLSLITTSKMLKKR